MARRVRARSNGIGRSLVRGQGTFERGERGVEVPAGGVDESAAAGTDGERPRGGRDPTGELEPVDDPPGSIDVADRERGLDAIAVELETTWMTRPARLGDARRGGQLGVRLADVEKGQGHDPRICRW